MLAMIIIMPCDLGFQPENLNWYPAFGLLFSWPPWWYSPLAHFCCAETWLRNCHILFFKKTQKAIYVKSLLLGNHQIKLSCEPKKTHLWPMDHYSSKYNPQTICLTLSWYIHVEKNGESQSSLHKLVNSRPLNQDIWVLDRVCVLNKHSWSFYAL